MQPPLTLHQPTSNFPTSVENWVPAFQRGPCPLNGAGESAAVRALTLAPLFGPLDTGSSSVLPNCSGTKRGVPAAVPTQPQPGASDVLCYHAHAAHRD